ncbi:Mur ligase family protein [Thermopirellula anaerolimosa]
MGVCPDAATTIRLNRLLPDLRLVGATDVKITGCRRHARRIGPGDLYVVTLGPGPKRDAAVREAVKRGCAAVLADSPLGDLPVPVCYVQDAKAAFGEVAQAIRGYPARKLHLVGVAGSFGKTTTACLIARILGEAGHGVGMLGTLGYFDGENSSTATQSTPDPDELADRLARMVASGCTHAVLELSATGLADKRPAGLSFQAVAVTNQWAGPGRADAVPIDALQYMAPDGCAVLNVDDAACRAAVTRIAKPALTVGLNDSADIQGREISRELGEETFFLTAGSETFPVQTKLFGRHHIRNCLVAAGVGLATGVPIEAVVKGLEAVTPLPGRMQPVICGQPFSVFVDAAADSHTLDAVLSTLRPLVTGRLICVSRPPIRRADDAAWMRVLEERVDMAVLTTGDPAHEDFSALIDRVEKHIYTPARYQRIANRTEAIAWTLHQAQQNDCVLIAGNGHRLWQPRLHDPLRVDDYQLARQWLYQEFEHAFPSP